MKTITIDQALWPVAESGDFDTRLGGEVFTVLEDEDGERFYSYGHIPAAEMIAEVTRYLQHKIPSGDFDEISSEAMHVHARFVDQRTQRWNWEENTAETPGAFPLTVASF